MGRNYGPSTPFPQLKIMRKVPLAEAKTDFSNADERMIREELQRACEDSEVEMDKEELTGEWKFWFFRVCYEWRIKRLENSYRVVQRTYLPKGWFLVHVYILAAFAAGLSTHAQQVITDTSQVGAYLTTMMVLSPALLIALLIVVLNHDRPLILLDLKSMSDSYTSIISFSSALILSSTLFAIGIFSTYTEFGIVTVLVTVMLVIIAVTYSFEPEIFHNLSRGLDWSLPVVSGKYLGSGSMLVALAVLPPILVWRMGPDFIFTSVQGYFMVTVYFIVFIGFLQNVRINEGEKDDVSEGRGKVENLLEKALLLLLCTAISYVSFFAPAMFFTGPPKPLRPEYYSRLTSLGSGFGDSFPIWSLDPPLHIYLMMLAGLLPAIYILVGLSYQVGSFLWLNHKRFQQGQPPERDFDVDATVLKIEDDRLGPAALNLGSKNYVFIPEGVFERCDKEEIDAIVAHEEGHIKHGDAFLSTVIPFLSLFLLTGRNIIFSILDFREREFRADEYAGEKVGTDTLTRAIRKSGDLNPDKQPETLIQENLSTFYGGFALSLSHPSIEERIDNIEQEKTN